MRPLSPRWGARIPRSVASQGRCGPCALVLLAALLASCGEDSEEDGLTHVPETAQTSQAGQPADPAARELGDVPLTDAVLTAETARYLHGLRVAPGVAEATRLLADLAGKFGTEFSYGRLLARLCRASAQDAGALGPAKLLCIFRFTLLERQRIYSWSVSRFSFDDLMQLRAPLWAVPQEARDSDWVVCRRMYSMEVVRLLRGALGQRIPDFNLSDARFRYKSAVRDPRDLRGTPAGQRWSDNEFMERMANFEVEQEENLKRYKQALVQWDIDELLRTASKSVSLAASVANLYATPPHTPDELGEVVRADVFTGRGRDYLLKRYEGLVTGTFPR